MQDKDKLPAPLKSMDLRSGFKGGIREDDELEASSEINSIFGGGGFAAGNQPGMDMYGHSNASVSAPVPVRSVLASPLYVHMLRHVKVCAADVCSADVVCIAGQGPPWRRAAGPMGHRGQHRDLGRWAISCARAEVHAAPRHTTSFARRSRIRESRWN